MSKTTFGVWIAILCSALCSGCGGGGPDSELAGLGDPCEVSADCQSGLKCEGLVCVDDGTGPEDTGGENDTGGQKDNGGGNTVDLTWIQVAGGTFQMGCNDGDAGCGTGESPAHSVTLSAFEMLETEVTENQFLAAMGYVTTFGGTSQEGSDKPADCVSWNRAKEFCEKVGGRLPTEAEWEFAARAGTTTQYSCGADASCLGQIAWFKNNSGSAKQTVKGKQAS